MQDDRVKDSAEKAALNEQYFCRFFKKAIGRSPMEYVNEYRIRQARRLLEETDLPVTEACLECGCSHLHISLFGFGNQFHHIIHGAKAGVYIVVIRDIISLIRQGRAVTWRKPDDIHTQVAQIIQFTDNTGEIPQVYGYYALTISQKVINSHFLIKETQDIHLLCH